MRNPTYRATHKIYFVLLQKGRVIRKKKVAPKMKFHSIKMQLPIFMNCLVAANGIISMLSYRWRTTTKWERINFMLNISRGNKSAFFYISSQYSSWSDWDFKVYNIPNYTRGEYFFSLWFFYIDLPFMNQERRFIYFIFILFISALEYNLPFPIFQRYPRQIKMQAFPSAYHTFSPCVYMCWLVKVCYFLFSKSFSIFSCFEFTSLITQMYI